MLDFKGCFFMEQENVNKNGPFRVPGGYFETLADRVMERVERERGGRKVTWRRALRPYVGLAAVFAGAMLVLHWVLPAAFPGRGVTEGARGGDVLEAYWEEVVEEGDFEFDEDFDPSREEILEYLTEEMDLREFYWTAGRF